MAASTLDPATAQRLRSNEAALLAGLEALDRAEQEGALHAEPLPTRWANVPEQEGRPAFSFPFHRVEPEVYKLLNRKATGVRRAGEPAAWDEQIFQCELIVEATAEPYRRALWGSERQKRHDCTDVRQLVRKLIPLPGDRQALCTQIDELGGYGTGQTVAFGPSSPKYDRDATGSRALDAADAELEDTLKN